MCMCLPIYCLTYTSLSLDMEVALVVNNLGGTSNLELSIMTNASIRYLGTSHTHTHTYSLCCALPSGCPEVSGDEGIHRKSNDLIGNGRSFSHSPETLPRLAHLPWSESISSLQLSQ